MDYITSEPGQNRGGNRGNHRRWMILAVFCIFLLFFGKWIVGNFTSSRQVNELGKVEVPDWVDVQIIPVDGTSRRGEKLEEINDIVIHYVGNPGSTAQQNHDYYSSPESEVSSHFVIGLNGEIIQCVPLNEKSSASNWRNRDTISIEVCHPDKTGKFTEKSYASLVKLTAWLIKQCGLDANHIIRHYDITGKECPLYFVQHEDKWEQFKENVANYKKW